MSSGSMPCAAVAALALLAAAAHAQGVGGSAVRVAGVTLGSGVPEVVGPPGPGVADHIAGGDFHAPNYLTGHPTAATLWPRVVHVPCKRDADTGDLMCSGYSVAPLRGEYIYLRPVVEVLPPRVSVPAAPKPESPPAAPPVRKKPMG